MQPFSSFAFPHGTDRSGCATQVGESVPISLVPAHAALDFNALGKQQQMNIDLAA
jgi:hypothetical protein